MASLMQVSIGSLQVSVSIGFLQDTVHVPMGFIFTHRKRSNCLQKTVGVPVGTVQSPIENVLLVQSPIENVPIAHRFLYTVGHLQYIGLHYSRSPIGFYIGHLQVSLQVTYIGFSRGCLLYIQQKTFQLLISYLYVSLSSLQKTF